MKICYALTIDSSGVYADLAYLSVLSLQLSNPASEVEVVVDDGSYDWLMYTRHPLLNGRCIIRPVANPFGRSILGSRFIKTSMRKIVKGDFLFLDTDTVVIRYLGDFGNGGECIAASSDRNFRKPYPHLPIEQKKIYDALKWVFPSKIYYNSGVMLVRDIPAAHILYDRWHSKWMEGVGRGLWTDQQSLNAVLAENPISIKHLDWRYNASSDSSPYYLLGAKVVHYYQSQKSPGGVAEYFTKLALCARGSGETVALGQLRGLMSSPLQLWKLYKKRRFIIQIPVKPLHQMMLQVRHVAIDCYALIKKCLLPFRPVR